MTLGQMIDVLERRDHAHKVRFDFMYFCPKGIGSYRGIYAHLAIGYEPSGDMTVADLLKLLHDADGKTFTGWKGGDFEMDRDTPVWVGNPGESAGTAIVDIHDRGYFQELATATCEPF